MTFSITPAAFADYLEGRIRKARVARQNARLHRELSRLPAYVAEDIGLGPYRDEQVNILDH